MATVASTDCIICREYLGIRTPAQVHHIAQGSSNRSDFLTAALCVEHHTGRTGVHGAGVKLFCNMYGLANEYHLLALQNKYMMIDGVIKR